MWKDYYNNPLESDIKVVLREGCIYCHRLILRTTGGPYFNMILGRCKDELSFPDYSDAAVKILIAYMYGLGVQVSVFDQWNDIIKLAYLVENSKLVTLLTENIPEDADILSVVQLACLYENCELMRIATDFVVADYYFDLRIMTEEYKKFRCAWMERKHDLLGLITIDSQYCKNLLDELSSDDNIDPEDLKYAHTLLEEFLMTVDFKQMSSDDIQKCATLPLIVDMPLVSFLLKSLPQSRPSHVFGDMDVLDTKKKIPKGFENAYPWNRDNRNQDECRIQRGPKGTYVPPTNPPNYRPSKPW